MTTPRTSRSLRRIRLATVCLAVAVGLPLAIDFSGSRETIETTAAIASTGETLTITDPVALSAHLPIVLEHGVLQSDVKNPKPADTISRLQLDRATLKVQLAGTTGKSAALANNTIVSHLAALNASTLLVKRSTVKFELADASTAVITDVTAEIKSHRKTFFSATGTGTFRGQAIRFEASWGAPSENKSVAAKPSTPLKLTVRASLLDAVFEGRFVTGDDPKLIGNADFRSRRMRALASWFGLPIPIGTDLRDASIVGPLEWHAGRLVFTQAAVAMDGNRGEGALTLRTFGSRPLIEGTLGFSSFDVSPHLTTLTKAAPDKGLGSHKESIPVAIDVDLRLSAGKVIAQNVELGRGAVTIAMKGGRVLAELAELDIEGGQASGRVSLDINSDTPRVGIKTKFSGIDPGRMFTGWLKRNPLLGRGDFTFEGFGHGETLPAVIDSLSGRGTFRLTEQGRLGLDLKALNHAAKSANHVSWPAAGKGGTPLEQLDSRFSYSNGALTVDQLQGKSAGQIITAAGKVDMQAKLLDLKVTMAPERPTAAAQGNAVPIAGTVPGAIVDASAQVRSQELGDILVIRGAWDDPAISVLGRPFTTTAPTAKGASVIVPQR